MAFSGGGTRAAALSYGILEALADVTIPGEVVFDPSASSASHRLLNEVDGIASVSGGSFTAAYFGLFGDRIFTDFRERFLLRNVQKGLFLKRLNPINTLNTDSPYFGRSDMAAEYYDRILFEEKKLGDIRSQTSPYIEIQATDIVNGLNFPFSPYMLSLICSDYDAVPVSRAVAASTAFPGPFTPIVLENRAGTCSFPTEAWVHQALEKRDNTNYDTYFLLQNAFKNWQETYEDSFPDMPKTEIYFSVIEFADLKNAYRRQYFSSIPTSFSLPEKTVDELCMVARELLYNSREFKRFVGDVGGSIPHAQNIDTKR